MNKKTIIGIISVFIVAAVVMSAGCIGTDVEHKSVTCYDDLIGAKVAVQMGTTGDYEVTAIADANPGTTVERYNKIVDGILSLKNGKVDCVVVDIETAKNYVSEGSGLKIIEDPTFVPEEYAFAVKKNKPQFLNELNTAIAELKADGTFDKISKYYLGLDGGEQYQKAEGINYKGDLKVATNAEFPPYEFKDGEKYVGIDMDVMQAIADKLELKLVVNDIAFDSILVSIQSGKDDVGASALSITEDRLKNVDFTDVYASTVQVIVVKE